jgi:hypothetical protein
MSQTVPLNPGLSATVVLDANGNGTVTIGPTIPGTAWQVSGVGVLVNGGVAVNVPTFTLYNGGPAPGNFLGGSYTGSNDSDTGLAITLTPGQILTGVWSGGDPGASATMSVNGTQTIG